MRSKTLDAVERTEPAVNDLDGFTSYEDDGHHVICDTQNPKAWIRSDETRSLSP